jgi:hypothetical protein
MLCAVGARARERWIIAVTPANDNVRVVADIAVITNPGSAFEQRTKMNHGRESANLQATLNAIKARLEAANNR